MSRYKAQPSPSPAVGPSAPERQSQTEAAHLAGPASLHTDACRQPALDPGPRVGARIHQLRLRTPWLHVRAVLPPATQVLPELLPS